MGETIFVTKAHIEGGHKKDGFSCMVAKAIQEQLDLTADYRVLVGYTIASIQRGSREGVQTKLPSSVGQRIRRWDQNVNTKPFSFELDLPDDWRERLRAK